MNYSILRPDFRKDSFLIFVIAAILAVIIVSVALVANRARAEEEAKYGGEKSDIISETRKWCRELNVSEDDTKLVIAIILAHNAVGQPCFFAGDGLGLASWIKMMRYLHDERKDERPLLDFCLAWYAERFNESFSASKEHWTDKVKIFLDESKTPLLP